MKLLLSLLTVFVFMSKAYSTQYYISTTGSDAATGLVGFPKKTLQSVISTYVLVSGDVINVAAGTYTTESNITLGATDVSFSIVGAGMSTTIFDFDQSNRFMTFSSTNDGISFSKLTIKDYKKSSDGGAIVMVSGADNCTFTNVTFDNCDANTVKGGALYLDGNIITLTKCIFKNCDAGSEGGSISSNNLACTITISKCKFYSNSGSYGSAIEVDGTSSSLTITNSLFYKNNATTIGTIGVDSGTSLSMSNCTVVYNTSSQSAAIVTWQLSGSTTSTIKNTISYGNTREDFYKNGGTMNLTNCRYITLFSGMTSNVSGTTSSPSFTNTATDDYTLLGSSNCIDGGVNVASGGMVDDLNSFTRVSLPDIGCYESNTVALPIELLYFRGFNSDSYNHLTWSTASEFNNDYFTIEKSIDGVYFYDIFKISGGGNSIKQLFYEYYDYNIENAISYYVLKQTDFDGKHKSSDIISIDNRKMAGPTLVKVVNLLGQEVIGEYKGILLFIYSDGTTIKRYF